MSAGRYNLTIEQGATFSLSMTWTDSASNPVDLTAFTARLHVRKLPTSATTVTTLTTENSRIALGGVAGTIQLSMLAADTAVLPAGEYVYDLEMVDGSNVTRLLEGACTIKPEVTR